MQLYFAPLAFKSLRHWILSNVQAFIVLLLFLFFIGVLLKLFSTAPHFCLLSAFIALQTCGPCDCTHSGQQPEIFLLLENYWFKNVLFKLFPGKEKVWMRAASLTNRLKADWQICFVHVFLCPVENREKSCFSSMQRSTVTLHSSSFGHSEWVTCVSATICDKNNKRMKSKAFTTEIEK